MKDWVFYPLVLLVVGLMVAFALSFAENEPIDPAKGIEISGADLANLVVAPGTSLEMAEDPQFGQIAKLSAHSTHKDAPSAGVFFALPTAYHQAYDGKNVTFEVDARQAAERGAQEFWIAFFSPNGSSGWKTIQADTEFQIKSLSYRLQREKDGDDYAYFGIWPDPEGNSHSIEIRSFKVFLADKQD